MRAQEQMKTYSNLPMNVVSPSTRLGGVFSARRVWCPGFAPASATRLRALRSRRRFAAQVEVGGATPFPPALGAAARGSLSRFLRVDAGSRRRGVGCSSQFSAAAETCGDGRSLTVLPRNVRAGKTPNKSAAANGSARHGSCCSGLCVSRPCAHLL